MNIKTKLDALGITPKKRWGQNYLQDNSIAKEITAFANIATNDQVLEIGPGLGMLTKKILAKTPNLTAIEYDRGLELELRRTFPNLNLIMGDAREFELSTLYHKEKFILISNVPYSISSEIILWIIANRKYLKCASLLLQREFAERIAASPSTRAYGSLSVLVSRYATHELGLVVSGDSFYPTAKVESRLIKLNILDTPIRAEIDDQLFERVLRASFGHRRKTLLNSLLDSKLFDTKEQTKAVLSKANIDGTRRAETLSLEEFLSIAEASPNH